MAIFSSFEPFFSRMSNSCKPSAIGRRYDVLFLLLKLNTQESDAAQGPVSSLPRWELRHRGRAGDTEVSPHRLPSAAGVGASLAVRIPCGLDAGVGRVHMCLLCHKSRVLPTGVTQTGQRSPRMEAIGCGNATCGWKTQIGQQCLHQVPCDFLSWRRQRRLVL